VYSFLLKKEIREDTILPCYFFYGEEVFPAYQFIKELESLLTSSDAREWNVERFNLEDNSWMEIIDTARTLPFFFSSRRIIIVSAGEGKGNGLTSTELKNLEDYFSDPPSHTVFVIIFSGKIRRNSSLYKFFSSLTSSVAYFKELKPLKDEALYLWIERAFSEAKKSVTDDAKKRIVELTGSNLFRLNCEIDKIVTFVGEKKRIDMDDVNKASGLIRSFIEWEMEKSLENADYGKCLIVLDNLLKGGTKPEFAVGIIAKFFRNIFLAKLLLKEKKKTKKEIFREFKPRIQEKFQKLYQETFRDFFSLVDSMSMEDLNGILIKLKNVDLKIKTTGLSSQTLLEGFLFDYCRMRKQRITWQGKG